MMDLLHSEIGNQVYHVLAHGTARLCNELHGTRHLAEVMLQKTIVPWPVLLALFMPHVTLQKELYHRVHVNGAGVMLQATVVLWSTSRDVSLHLFESIFVPWPLSLQFRM